MSINDKKHGDRYIAGCICPRAGCLVLAGYETKEVFVFVQPEIPSDQTVCPKQPVPVNMPVLTGQMKDLLRRSISYIRQVS